MGEGVKNDGIANNNRVATPSLALLLEAWDGGEAKERESEGEEG